VPDPAGSAARHPPALRSSAPRAHAAYPDGRIAPRRHPVSPGLPAHPPGPATSCLMRRGRSASPARALVDLLQRHTLVLAVIPLDQALRMILLCQKRFRQRRFGAEKQRVRTFSPLGQARSAVPGVEPRRPAGGNRISEAALRAQQRPPMLWLCCGRSVNSACGRQLPRHFRTDHFISTPGFWQTLYAAGSCRKSGHPMPRPSSYAVRSLAAIRSSSHRRRPPRRQLVCGEANRRTSPIAATSPAATVTLRPLYTTHCWSCRWHLLSAGERHDAGYQRQLQQQLRDWLIAMASLSAPISAPATEASEPDPVCILFEGRDGAGKGGTIKAITERVSPRCHRS